MISSDQKAKNLNPIKHQKEVMSNEERENLREAYLERSAILEFDAGMTRQEANRLAWLMVYGRKEKLPL